MKNEKGRLKIAAAGVAVYLLVSFPVRAIEQQFGMNNVRFTGQGALGAINGGAFADYLARLQVSRPLSNGWNFGAVYSYDQRSDANDGFAKDAFAYVETGSGRVEAGWTDTIASKLALVLPDVGGVRINNASFIYDRDRFYGFTNPSVRGAQYSWRVNYASLPTRPFQFGFSRTINGAGFKSASDFALRFRDPNGRIKTSFSIGASYIDSPDNMSGGGFLGRVTAKARYQGIAGLNVQSGSLLWAATFKAVVDVDAITPPADGIQAGTGFSYDFLSFSASVNYIFSDVGIWDNNPRMAHTGIASLRYKISRMANLWLSGGIVRQEQNEWFGAAGIGAAF